MTAVFSPEQHLILAAIRPQPAVDALLPHLLEQNLDWAEVVRFAIGSGVGALAYQGLRQLGCTNLPQAALARLQEIYQLNALRNLRLSKRLVQVVELLDKHGVDSLAYKGPAAALQAYPDLSLRQFTDLDLLIQPQDFPKVYALLVQAGCTPSTPLNNTGQRWLVQTAVEFPFQFQNDILEIHWGLALDDHLHPLKTSAFWNDSVEIEILDRRVRTLSPEKAVFFTCFHATRHAWGSLKWAADLAHYGQSYPALDWLALLEYARRSGFHRLVCLSLLLAERLGGAVFPPQVSQHIAADAHAQALARKVIQKIASAQPESSAFSRLGFFFRSRERLRDRLYIILVQIFIPREIDWRTIPLPAPFFPLYFLLRPLRVFVRSIWLLSSNIHTSKNP